MVNLVSCLRFLKALPVIPYYRCIILCTMRMHTEDEALFCTNTYALGLSVAFSHVENKVIYSNTACLIVLRQLATLPVTRGRIVCVVNLVSCFAS